MPVCLVEGHGCWVFSSPYSWMWLLSKCNTYYQRVHQGTLDGWFCYSLRWSAFNISFLECRYPRFSWAATVGCWCYGSHSLLWHPLGQSRVQQGYSLGPLLFSLDSIQDECRCPLHKLPPQGMVPSWQSFSQSVIIQLCCCYTPHQRERSCPGSSMNISCSQKANNFIITV